MTKKTNVTWIICIFAGIINIEAATSTRKFRYNNEEWNINTEQTKGSKMYFYRMPNFDKVG